ncbi:beta strand repeat-containing protein [Cerasicoccus frondis]|uniref:beta strand repeat-containing protein n=1 Tax=Cerasicoccus frondis TaxID=490090 RepID=UPI002852D5A8|nr:hypothetical protein [Cerasicoccus frondis]
MFRCIGTQRGAKAGLISLLLLGASTSLQGLVYTWSGGGSNGYWNNPANWYSLSVPSFNADVFFDAPVSGTVEILAHQSISVNTLYLGRVYDTPTLAVGSDGSATFTTASVAEIGSRNNADATLIIDNDSTWYAHKILIGNYNATGTVSIIDGLLDVDDYVTIGAELQSVGYLTLDKDLTSATAEIAANLNVGLYGEGTVELQDSAEMTVGGLLRLGIIGSDSYGKILLSNSTLNVTSNDIYVGDQGVGKISITGDGSLYASHDVYVGRQSGSDGDLLIASEDSYMQAANLTVGGTATASANSAAVIQVYGTLDVVGVTRLWNTADFQVIEQGSYTTDNLVVSPGGGESKFSLKGLDETTIHIGAMTVGDATNGDGTATFALADRKTNFAIGDEASSYSTWGNQINVVGSSGVTNVTVEEDATWRIEDGSVSIGSVSGLAGKVLVEDGGTLLLADSNEALVIGDDGGTGTLTHAGTGSVSLGGSVTVGAVSGSVGYWENAQGSAGSVRIGQDGYGEVTISSGTLAVTNGFDIGDEGSGSGKLTVDDATLTVGTDFSIIVDALSEVLVQNGASFQVAGDLSLSLHDNQNYDSEASTFSVESTDSIQSSLTLEGNLLVGENGSFYVSDNSNVIIGNGSTSGLPTTGYVLVSGTGVTPEIYLDGTVTLDEAFYAGWNSGEYGGIEVSGEIEGSFTTNADVHLGEYGESSVNFDVTTWNANGSALYLGYQGGVADLYSNAFIDVSGDLYAGAAGGVVDIEMTSNFSVGGKSYLGQSGALTTLWIYSNAGSLNFGDDCYIGDNATGQIDLNDGALLTSTGSIYVGLNQNGVGVLNMGFYATSGSLPGIILGSGDGSASGTLTVSYLSAVKTSQLYVGSVGYGKVVVQDSDEYGDYSSLTIENTGASRFEVASVKYASGDVEITDGAQFDYQEVTDDTAIIGVKGLATFLVSGADSSASFSSSLAVGKNHDAKGSSLKVEDGAAFYGTTVYVRNASTATFTGVGTMADISGSLITGSSAGNGIYLDDGAALSVGGTLQIGTNATFKLANGATLKAMDVLGNLTNTSGIFSPGASPAAVTVDGDYQQSSSGELVLELGGTTAGTEYDVLTVTGTVTLAGALTIDLIDDFTPNVGDSFTVLNYTTLVDNGVSLSLPDLSDGLAWSSDWGSTSLTLTVGYSDDMAGFRTEYGLAADGSDDDLDWSDNGLENILYYAFGLGDPSSETVNEDYLPSFSVDSSGAVFYSFVRLIDSSEIVYTVYGSYDLEAWVDVLADGADPSPDAGDIRPIDDDYEEVMTVFPIAEDPIFLYVDVEVSD